MFVAPGHAAKQSQALESLPPSFPPLSLFPIQRLAQIEVEVCEPAVDGEPGSTSTH